MPTSLTKAMIEIQTRGGRKEVAGETLPGGLFAISNMPPHRRRDFGAKWCITHLPTGYAISSFDRKPKAQACVKALLALPGIDWTRTEPTYFRDPITAKRVCEVFRAIR